jgi:hypothetical protein
MTNRVTEPRCPKEGLGRTWSYVALDRRVLAVALKGDVNDWACYIGPVNGDSHLREAEDVAHGGSKLNYWIAKGLFPWMDALYDWRD